MHARAKITSHVKRLAKFVMRNLGARPIQAPPIAEALPKGWRSIDDTKPEDVFIVAYPKSGITWFQNLVVGTLFGIDPDQAPDSLVQDLVPDVHYKSAYKRYREPTLFKSHYLPRPEYRRVVYLVRDGRDVMVSYWRHLQALAGRNVDFMSILTTATPFPCPWQEHVQAWTANPYGASILTIRYEDLKNDTISELKRFSAFLGEPREMSTLRRVVAQCSFEAMRAREQRFGWDNPEWPKDQPFVRRGTVGAFKDEMPAEALAHFLEEAGSTLSQLGYS